MTSILLRRCVYCSTMRYPSNRQKLFSSLLIIRLLLLMNYLITGITILPFCCTVGILSRNTLRPPDGSSQWITWYTPSCTLTMHSRQWGTWKCFAGFAFFANFCLLYNLIKKGAGKFKYSISGKYFSLPVNSRDFLWFWVKFVKSRIYKIIQETKMS